MRLRLECRDDGTLRVLDGDMPLVGVAFALIHYHADASHPPTVTLEFQDGEQREFLLSPPNLELTVVPSLQPVGHN